MIVDQIEIITDSMWHFNHIQLNIFIFSSNMKLCMNQGGAVNQKVGGVNALEGGGVNAVKQ